MSQRVPTVRPISWLATIPQFFALATSVAVACYFTRSPQGMIWGAAAYLLYSFGSRQIIARSHRRAIRLALNRRFAEAIPVYQESYDFFTRHSWLDRYRAITMMTPGAMSYREMALINIAFAYSQIGNGGKAKEYYQRASQEFPGSSMANAALKMIESIEQSSADRESAG